MIQAFFLDYKEGRLTRLAFLGYSLLLAFIAMLLGGTILALVMGTGFLSGGDATEQAQMAVDSALSWPVLTLLYIISLACIFIYINLSGKRLRDIGLPGLPTAGALLAVSAAASSVISHEAGEAVTMIAWLAMVFTPGNLMNKS